jgi:hypothetical protein
MIDGYGSLEYRYCTHRERGEERVLHDMFKAECAKDFVAFTSYVVDALGSA